jgi:hypothetical protein
MFVALLCLLLATQQITAVVNNQKTTNLEEPTNKNISNVSTSAKVADSVSSATEQEAKRREAPILAIGDTYGAPLSGGGIDSYVPTGPSNPTLPIPVYGVPDAPSNNIVYPAPPPDLPPPLPAISTGFVLPLKTYGPPQPVDHFGGGSHLDFVPPPPPTKYGPPIRPAKPFHSGGFHGSKVVRPRPAKPIFVPKLTKPSYGPPKQVYGPPKSPLFVPHKNNFKQQSVTIVTIPSHDYAEQNAFGASQHSVENYGPPEPVPHGPPHPGVPAPPTPPDIKYDGWQPIPGLVSRPPSDSYGVPEHDHHGAGDLHLNADFTPPPVGGGHGHTTHSVNVEYSPPNHGVSDSYGAPLNSVTGSGAIVSSSGETHHDDQSLSLGLSAAGINSGQSHLSVIKSIGYEIFPNGGGGLSHIGDSYSSPPLSSYSPDGPYAAAHSHKTNGLSSGGSFSSVKFHHAPSFHSSHGSHVSSSHGSHGLSYSSSGHDSHGSHGLSYSSSGHDSHGSHGLSSGHDSHGSHGLSYSSSGHDSHGSHGLSSGHDSHGSHGLSYSSSGHDSHGSHGLSYSSSGHGSHGSHGLSYSSSGHGSHGSHGLFHSSSHSSHGLHGSHGLSSSSFGLIPPSGFYGAPSSGHHGTPLLTKPSPQYGPPLNALKINPPKHPVVFREPVPAGLIESIGQHTAHKDAHGVIENSHSGSYISGPTYIPPPIPDVTKPVREEEAPAPSNLYSLPNPSSAVSFQNLAHGSFSSGINSIGFNSGFGGGHSHALTSYTAPLGSIDGSYSLPLHSGHGYSIGLDNAHSGGITVGLDNTHPPLTIDLTSSTTNLGKSIAQVPHGYVYQNLQHDCPSHKSQPLPSLSYGVPSANSYTASLSSLTTNIGGAYQGPAPALSYGPPDLQTAHSKRVSTRTQTNSKKVVTDLETSPSQKVNTGVSVNSVEGSHGKNYGKSLAQKFGVGSELIKSESIDINNIPVRGSLGSYTLQIQPADSLGGLHSSSEHVPHAQVLNDGLLQSILAAIEQPQRKDVRILGHPLVHLQPSQSYDSSESDSEGQSSVKNAVVVPAPATEATPSTSEVQESDANSSLHLIDNNEIALYFNNNPQDDVSNSHKNRTSEVRNGQQYGNYVSFKTPNSSFVYGKPSSAKSQETED